jgi:Enoyl-(Acyl carrier protein) reductase
MSGAAGRGGLRAAREARRRLDGVVRGPKRAAGDDPDRRQPGHRRGDRAGSGSRRPRRGLQLPVRSRGGRACAQRSHRPRPPPDGRTARRAARAMAVRRGGIGGSIVSVSSGAATLGSPHEYVHNAAAKAGVDALTVGLAKELAEDGIRVNAVAPGLVNTTSMPPRAPPTERGRSRRGSPWGGWPRRTRSRRPSCGCLVPRPPTRPAPCCGSPAACRPDTRICPTVFRPARERLAGDPLKLSRRMAELLEVDPERVRLWLFARCAQEAWGNDSMRGIAARLAP